MLKKRIFSRLSAYWQTLYVPQALQNSTQESPSTAQQPWHIIVGYNGHAQWFALSSQPPCTILLAPAGKLLQH
ncbi:hypothetical protein [Phaeodactylibacter luteus]|uniref:Uncharacterized protein n=1 Tax=Phaeodactylibacter luteus TaxID=1564516 RepID=A0A5C6RS86_9BACT|nr:hypothetical protein [Phaeodactylibacter luteus]TXB64162.1 hypothetical protein FRY97_07665 [Phaeodactylibacter luteus]